MKKNISIIIMIFLSIYFFYGCGSDSISNIQTSPDYTAKYLVAVEDSIIAEEDDICTTLVKITLDNDSLQWMSFNDDSYVLTLHWTQYDSYNNQENETMALVWGKTWVTIPYEMKEFISNTNIDTMQIILRYEQLFGLPPNSGKEWFIEIWVNPEDLLRPSPDNEIYDSRAELDFPTDPPPSYQYVQWFYENMISSYYGENKYPWTRLGYTYDWGNPDSKIGLSEFVIKKNAIVIIKSVTATLDYR
jgi:hypothetical protein